MIDIKMTKNGKATGPNSSLEDLSNLEDAGRV